MPKPPVYNVNLRKGLIKRALKVPVVSHDMVRLCKGIYNLEYVSLYLRLGIGYRLYKI